MIISITRPFLVSILTVFMYQSLPASVRPPTPTPHPLHSPFFSPFPPIAPFSSIHLVFT